MTHNAKLFGLGIIKQEFIGIVDRIPSPGQFEEFSSFSIQPSGRIHNALRFASILGLKSGMVGYVGSDKRGEEMLESMKLLDIDTQEVQVLKGAVTPLAFHFAQPHDSNFRLMQTFGTVPEPKTKDFDIDRIVKQFDIFMLDDYAKDLGLSLTKAAHAAEKKVIYAPTHDDAIADFLPFIDLLVVSEPVAARYSRRSRTHEITAKIIADGAKSIFITLGADGVAGEGVDQPHLHLPAYPVDVVDTLGSTSAFLAGAAFYLSQGASLGEMMQFANICAGMSCTDFGPRGYTPSLSDLDERFRTKYATK